MLAQRKAGQVVSITVQTGGSGYSSQPSVSLTGGGGTGAAAVAHMAGTQVESIAIVSGGTGYTSDPNVIITGAGTGAVASAYAYTGPIRPVTMVRSRFNNLYSFDGMGRGLRWDGSAATMQPIGVQKPALPPAVTVASTAMSGSVAAVNVVSRGFGYSTPPAVVFTGGSPSKAATGRAQMFNGQVAGVTIVEPGTGYVTAPAVSFSGGTPSLATLSVGVRGAVADLFLTSAGTGYTTAPTLVFSSAQGLTQALGTVTVANSAVDGVFLQSGGTGATGAVTASLVGGGGTGAAVSVQMRYSVAAVTVVTGGSAQYVAPTISFRAATGDVSSTPAQAVAYVNSTGAVTGVTVLAGGAYSDPPTAYIENPGASAYATLTNALQGTYKCAIRYVDNTPVTLRGPVPSSISDMVEVAIPDGAASLTWTLSHSGVDSHVSAVELYRTTADQGVLLYRVATIPRASWSTPYTDSLRDEDLTDPERQGYGLLPVTLPSGQANARRFGVPPGNYAVACMFQDRVWMAVDTSGKAPNSLVFSEIDEPESFPVDNELILQESAGDSDAIVALVPLGSMMLIAQQRHLYRLQYVSQPVIDASIILAGYRGILNSRCWDVLAGVAYLADSNGVYAFDGNSEKPVSTPVDNLWRDGSIDFSKAAQFHMQADPLTKIVRFFYCEPTDSQPVRALCYGVLTEAWWQETYPTGMTAGASATVVGQQSAVYGTQTGSLIRHGGFSDSGTAIPWSIRTGNLAFADDGGDRSISILYTPTSGNTDTRLKLYYNGSANDRPNVVASDRGQVGVAEQGGGVLVNLNKSVSPLGDSPGVARVYFSGRPDSRSAGGDKHVALGLEGTQASSDDAPVIHAIAIAGVK